MTETYDEKSPEAKLFEAYVAGMFELEGISALHITDHPEHYDFELEDRCLEVKIEPGSLTYGNTVVELFSSEKDRRDRDCETGRASMSATFGQLLRQQETGKPVYNIHRVFKDGRWQYWGAWAESVNAVLQVLYERDEPGYTCKFSVPEKKNHASYCAYVNVNLFTTTDDIRALLRKFHTLAKPPMKPYTTYDVLKLMHRVSGFNVNKQTWYLGNWKEPASQINRNIRDPYTRELNKSLPTRWWADEDQRKLSWED